jgi:hypothetical protein
MNNKSLKVILILDIMVTSGLLIYIINSHNIEIDFSDKILEVKGLVVTDSTGRERVIIGSHFPPPQGIGHRKYRGDNSGVSGIMLYDHEGQERGGYVTGDSYGNIFLSLDSKISQRVLFMAEPQGAAVLKMWGKNGNEINLGASDDGTWINVTDQGNEKSLLEQ